MASRRRILQRLAGLTGVAGLTGCTRLLTPSRPEPHILDLPPNPHAGELPARQHAWKPFLRTDRAGNQLRPRHHSVLLLELDASPDIETARTTERAMRTIEAAYNWTSEGVFHMLVWGSGYFERIGELDPSPIRHPQVLSRTDDPELLRFDAALVLSSDVPSHLTGVENAMFGGRTALNGESVEDQLDDVFSVVDRRTGFLGEGLPAAHTDAEGIPDNPPLSDEAHMFMGFRSGRTGTQASENRVTIDDGAFVDGTTMHLAHLRQSLDGWFETLDETGRVAHMFSPEFSPGDIAALTDDVPFSDRVREHARGYSVVGHHEKVARARENGEPLVLRRDFNTVDGGHAGVHFLSLQHSLEDFATTRRAMNGWYLRDDSEAITDRKHNGILDFITVVSRANFYVPPRERRAFPVL